MTALIGVLLLAGGLCTVAAVAVCTGDAEDLGRVVSRWRHR